jgi:hypothetical protein
VEYGGYGHYIKTMSQAISSGVGNAKLSAGIPALATVTASVLNPGLALPAVMIPGVRADSHVPQAFMNIYAAIAALDQTQLRI